MSFEDYSNHQPSYEKPDIEVVLQDVKAVTIEVVEPNIDVSLAGADEDYAKTLIMGSDILRGNTLIVPESMSETVTTGVDNKISFERRRTGPKKSSHGVFFGDLNIGGVNYSVAMRPYSEAAAKDSILDYSRNKIAIQRCMGNLAHLGVLGFEDGPKYVVTLLEEGLSTLDSMDWSEFRNDPESKPSEPLVNILNGAAREIAYAHHKNIGHGDLAARNIAVTTRSAIFLIDWEKAQVHKESYTDVEVRFGSVMKDMRLFIPSLINSPEHPLEPGLGLLDRNRSFEDNWAILSAKFVEPYEQWRSDFVSGMHKERLDHHSRNERSEDLESELEETRKLVLQLLKEWHNTSDIDVASLAIKNSGEPEDILANDLVDAGRL